MARSKLTEKSEQEKRDKRFEKLEETFRDAIAQSSTDEIRKRVSEIALLEADERELLAMDPDVNQAKDALKELMEPYRENLKEFKLKIEYCKWSLEQKGAAIAVSKRADEEMNEALKTIMRPSKDAYLASVTFEGRTTTFPKPDDAE